MTTRSKQLLLVLFLALFLIVIPVIAIMTWMPPELPATGRSAVVLELGGELLDYSPALTPGLLLGRRALTQTDCLAIIEAAARDRHVGALVLKIQPTGAGAAKCEELADAVRRFRARGKTVISFSSLLWEHHYTLACAADSVFMPPSGFLLIPGPASSALFIRGTLDKLGISPNIHRIEKYKSAAEMYTERERTPESRENAAWLLDEYYDAFVRTIAAARGRSEDSVRALVDHGLYSPRRALAAGLIDGIHYWDEVEKIFKDGDLRMVNAHEYLRKIRLGPAGGQTIAVVHAQGLITEGESGYDPVYGETMGAQSVARELRKARDDKGVRAVILRIDSPGGSGIAGEMISREVEMTAEKKPVVVSMSDVAASGGYEIAYRADHIVAMPGTITGSIGSITGKMNMRGLYDKIGVTKDEIGTGSKSLIYSDYRDFTPEERQAVEEEHWEFYRTWIEDIARCREMSVDSIDALGRGRVWTGSQALARGLVDELGGLDRAVSAACELANIEDTARVALVHYPRRLSLFQEIFSRGFFEDVLARAIHGAIGRDEAIRRELMLWRVSPIERIQ